MENKHVLSLQDISAHNILGAFSSGMNKLCVDMQKLLSPTNRRHVKIQSNNSFAITSTALILSP